VGRGGQRERWSNTRAPSVNSEERGGDTLSGLSRDGPWAVSASGPNVAPGPFCSLLYFFFFSGFPISSISFA
jgi:hypothetical protein